MSTRGVIRGVSGFPVRWFDGCAVVGLPAGIGLFTAPAVAGELCAVLESGGRGLIVDLSGAGCCDAACLSSLVRAARRARGWGSWVRVVAPDPHVRRVVRLVSLDEVMPVHASVAEAVAAAGRERGHGRQVGFKPRVGRWLRTVPGQFRGQGPVWSC